MVLSNMVERQDYTDLTIVEKLYILGLYFSPDLDEFYY